MKSNRRTRIPVALMAVAVSAGCSARGTNYAALSPDSLFALGTARLEAEDWDRARMAFDHFTYEYPTHELYREARFRLADAYFGEHEYVTAAIEYGRFANDYPDHPLGDDARFRVCEAYRELSPKPQLYQEHTYQAIDHCASLLAYYPNSEFAPRAETILKEMYEKLAEKKYDQAEHYRRIDAEDSAIITYQQLLSEFPSSKFAPKALLRLYTIYAELEYTEEAREVRERLLAEYPNSEEARAIGGAPLAGAP